MEFGLIIRHLFNKTLRYQKLLRENSENWQEVFENQVPPTVSAKKRLLLGKSLFVQLLKRSIEDLNVSSGEKAELTRVIQYFNLPVDFVTKVKRTLNETAVTKLISLKYNDHILTEEEKKEIIDFAEFLELHPSVVERIRNQVASSLFMMVVNQKLSDRKLTPVEETELSNALTNLQIDNVTAGQLIPNKTLQDLAFAKLLWQLENGIFSEITNAQIVLQKNEKCYMGFHGSVLESKVVTTGYTSASSGVSIKIAKGVRYRVGSTRSRAIKEQVTIRHSGVLYLTSKRIVFASTGKHSFSINFDKLLSFDPYSDGISFSTSGKGNFVELRNMDVELFATGLTSAIRNFMDGDNSIVQNAQREIGNNSSFIDISSSSN